MLTAVLATKLIRQILVDYNYWPESESDSPLKIARSKTALTETVALSRDAAMRKAAVKTVTPAVTGYKPPERRVEFKMLDDVFKPMISRALQEVHAAAQAVNTSSVEISTLEMPIEAAEFYVQLHGAFNQLSNPKVCYIYDGDSTSSDPYTGFFISGETSDGETIIAQTLLTQT